MTTCVAAERDGDEGEEDAEEDDAGEEEFEDGGGEGEVGSVAVAGQQSQAEAIHTYVTRRALGLVCAAVRRVQALLGRRGGFGWLQGRDLGKAQCVLPFRRRVEAKQHLSAPLCHAHTNRRKSLQSSNSMHARTDRHTAWASYGINGSVAPLTSCMPHPAGGV